MDHSAVKIVKNLRYLELKEKTSKAFQNSSLFFSHNVQKNYHPLLMTLHASQFSSTTNVFTYSSFQQSSKSNLVWLNG